MATQLVAVLLDQGVLGGPGDVTKPLAIAAGSTTQFIRTRDAQFRRALRSSLEGDRLDSTDRE